MFLSHFSLRSVFRCGRQCKSLTDFFFPFIEGLFLPLATILWCWVVDRGLTYTYRMSCKFCVLAAVQSELCLSQSVCVLRCSIYPQNTALGKREETWETQNQREMFAVCFSNAASQQLCWILNSVNLCLASINSRCLPRLPQLWWFQIIYNPLSVSYLLYSLGKLTFAWLQ